MTTAQNTPPLTVAYIGNFRHPWCTEVHVAGSLRALGHTVVRLQEDELDWSELPSRAAACHLVLWTRTWAVDDVVAMRALADLRAARIPTVSFHLDRWWGLDREYQVATQPFFRTDLVVSPDGANDDRWIEAGVNHLYLPPGVYAAECEPVAPNPRVCRHEVVFVGTLPYPHKEWHPYRAELVQTFKTVFGRRFGVYPRVKGRPIRGRQLQELYATAKVVVGDSCLAGGATHYWSDRVPETLGRGGLLIHPEVPGMGEWYVNHAAMAPAAGTGDLLTYELGRFEQAVVLAEWALANPADAREVAEHGRATVLARDTYAHRMTTVIEHVEETLGLGRGPLATTTPVCAPAGPDRAAPPQVLTVRHRKHRGAHGEFELAAGDPDNVAVWEVWQDDTYRLVPDQFRGLGVVDIGCNLGAFSVLAAKLGAAYVHAYEPLPRVAAVAEANMDRNHVQAKVTIHQAAVGGTAGTGWLSDVAAGGAHLAAETETGMEVPMVDVNEVIDRAAAAGTIGLLKIDCEGGEFAIIEAVRPEQLVKVRHICMEFHGPGMPHLTHLEGPPAWGRMVAKLAEYGHLKTLGRPSVGGLLWWDRY